MKRHLFTAILCLAALALKAQVGTWTLYPAYNEPQQIVSVGHVYYVLSEGDLYACNTSDGSVTTYDKQKNLSDYGIAYIAWCAEAKRLVIVYSNQNIDLLEENGNVVNISDYYYKSLSVDKTVYGLNIEGAYAYLSTGFGILKLNVRAAEITDTYNLGFKVNWTHLDAENIYAESETAGKYAAPLASNLLDRANWKRLSRWTKEDRSLAPEELATVKAFKADGPRYNNFYRMQYADGKLYATGGFYLRSYSEKNLPGVIQVYDGQEWSFLGDNLESIVGYDVRDNNSIAIDPKDSGHIFFGGRTGLYEYQDGEFVRYYNIDNSPLITAAKDGVNKGYTLVEAQFDPDGTLWVLNIDQLLRREADGTLTVVNDEFKGGKGIGSLTVDSYGLVWFAFFHWDYNAIFCYNPATDQLKRYSTFINEDGANVTSPVKSIAEDKHGNVWFGTVMGPIYLSRQTIESGGSEFMQVKVPRNDGTNLADYLLSGIEISAIAVDGANRKWFGTPKNGVYVISDDCYTQESNFVAAETPLVADEILAITIDHQSGQVYMATSRGLCSYMSDATQGAEQMDKNNIVAYPNPVTPDYTGLITITGFAYDTTVKIVSADGSLVCEGRSNGGTYTWDGTDLDGRPVASGVYMILAATSGGRQAAVGKVAVVR